MTFQHLGILTLVFVFLLAVPSLSDDNQIPDSQRNVGEPDGNVRTVNDKNRNKNEKSKEMNFNKKRNEKEKKKEKNFKKDQNKLEGKKEKAYNKKYGNSAKTGTCSGTGADWSCCSRTNPCQEKQGDCDRDSHCAGSLVCGKDNCRDFNAKAHRLADCCIDACTGTSADWSCCSSSSPCQENQGDCDNDSECAGSLVCGTDNCKSINPLARGKADCCVKPNPDAGTGSSSDWSFCSSSYPCQEKRGDCDNDSECAGSLICGKNNCKDFHPLAQEISDCCIRKPDKCIGSSSDWRCCTSSSPCQENQGDCDNDSECVGSLVCGKNNCKNMNPLASSAADCCTKSSGSLVSAPTTTATTATSIITTPNNDKCKCGIKKKGTRIVGGVQTEVNEYPWMALLSMGCGGSLISGRWVVTAAHCFYDGSGVQVITNPSSITITLGEHDKSITTETLLTKEVTPNKIIIHELYNPSLNLNDIALLRLETDIDLNIYTPICLPPQGELYTGQKVWVYGWGASSEFLGAIGSYPNILQELEITVVSDAVAKSRFRLNDEQLAVMIFAGGEEGKDACQGDSGGPLSYDRNGRHELIGATSWGHGCGRDGNPGVYTELSAFRNWIDQKIGGGISC